jgi:hypothetical protein
MFIQWIASLCLAMSATFAYAGSSKPFELKGSLAFAGNPGQYLFVYASNEFSGGPNVYGRVVSPDGDPLGKDFRLSTQTGEMSKPVLTYNALTSRFLVVWGRKLYDEDRAEIIGRLVGLDGKIAGDEFRISFSGIYDQRPAIAYCPGLNRFLVTWTRGTAYDPDRGVADIYGQFLAGDGRLQGSNFAIASDAKNQFKSDVNCNPATDRLLVVWEDQRRLATHDDVYGQLMSSDGTMIGGNFPIAETENLERRPVVCANPKDGTYLLVWETEAAGRIGLLSQKIDANGRLLRTPVPIGSRLGGSRNRAAVSYLQGVFLVVFYNSGFDGLSDGIHGQFVESNGDLRQTTFPVTTAEAGQYRPDVSAAWNTFLVAWTDYRDTLNADGKHNVYEYYGRVIGNDVVLSSRWKNPDSMPESGGKRRVFNR